MTELKIPFNEEIGLLNRAGLPKKPKVEAKGIFNEGV
jgi:hypothetical protein